MKAIIQMASSMKHSGWTPVLVKVAKNVQKRVKPTLERHRSLGKAQLKEHLDMMAQDAIRAALVEAGISAQIISEEGNYSTG